MSCCCSDNGVFVLCFFRSGRGRGVVFVSRFFGGVYGFAFGLLVFVVRDGVYFAGVVVVVGVFGF